MSTEDGKSFEDVTLFEMLYERISEKFLDSLYTTTPHFRT